ncbi:sugar kinase [Actinomadura viridis]|uniref:2-dehydro-3-deoxygluconokinase n=1 Tax=Actinomadura viridis TaxID=58110 RepID=A0A931DRP8_9ACTN|nr:sugar kinase [Actinomadura viridis]MBG6092190.1 2-dehydro-3-deoxygluconokinase [Actinomadura viridis]
MSAVPDILAVGEPMLEFNAAEDGPLHAAGSFTVGYGGDSSNFAVAAARSGASTGYVTRIGDDEFGTAFLRLWEREGVDAAHVVREPGGRTGVYFIGRGPEGSTFTYYRDGSPASRLAPADIPEEAVANARLLHLTGITQAISTSAADAAFHAMDLARRHGTLVTYDPNHRPALWPVERARAIVMRSVELSDIVLPNIEEGRLLTGAHAPEAVAEAFAARGPRTVVLKMGADGALLSHDGTITRIDPYRVERPVDPSGAGDTFDGAFAARLLEGAPPVEAARYAAVAAALTTTGHGAVRPIPSRAAVEQAMSA